MFWNDPNLYSVAFKDVPNVPFGMFGTTPRIPYGTPPPYLPQQVPYGMTPPYLPPQFPTFNPYLHTQGFTPFINPVTPQVPQFTSFSPYFQPPMMTPYNWTLPLYNAYRPFIY